MLLDRHLVSLIEALQDMALGPQQVLANELAAFVALLLRQDEHQGASVLSVLQTLYIRLLISPRSPAGAEIPTGGHEIKLQGTDNFVVLLLTALHPQQNAVTHAAYLTMVVDVVANICQAIWRNPNQEHKAQRMDLFARLLLAFSDTPLFHTTALGPSPTAFFDVTVFPLLRSAGQPTNAMVDMAVATLRAAGPQPELFHAAQSFCRSAHLQGHFLTRVRLRRDTPFMVKQITK